MIGKISTVEIPEWAIQECLEKFDFEAVARMSERTVEHLRKTADKLMEHLWREMANTGASWRSEIDDDFRLSTESEHLRASFIVREPVDDGQVVFTLQLEYVPVRSYAVAFDVDRAQKEREAYQRHVPADAFQRAMERDFMPALT